MTRAAFILRNLPLLLMVVVLAACKDETMVGDAPEPGNETYAVFLQFSTIGLTNPSWSYSSVIASHDPSTGVTTIETYDDSTMFGKFILSFTGGGPGPYRYTVVGSPTDTNQVDIWFAPLYSGTPTGVFELTGIPEDSLDATVSVNYFGGIGDSISGTMSASLKLAGSSPPFTAILYSGKFLVKRTAPPQGTTEPTPRSGSDPSGFTLSASARNRTVCEGEEDDSNAIRPRQKRMSRELYLTLIERLDNLVRVSYLDRISFRASTSDPTVNWDR